MPPYLTYAYVPESPALIEGSIYRNLILGVDPDKKEQPTAEQVHSATNSVPPTQPRWSPHPTHPCVHAGVGDGAPLWPLV